MLGNCYFDVKSIAFFTNMEFNKHICISVEGIFLLTIWIYELLPNRCVDNYDNIPLILQT